MFQYNDTMGILDWGALYEPFIVIIIMITTMGLMVLIHTKYRIWLLSLITFAFSLIFGVMSLSYDFLPFTPYFSMFYILFQSLLFFLTTIEVSKY